MLTEVMNMKKSLGDHTMIFPQPVMLIGTYDENGKEDVMNVAWGGQCGPKQISMSLSRAAQHQTTSNLEKQKAFTIAYADEEHLVQADYVGLVSGKNTPDKMKRSGFTFTKSPVVNAPVINELPLSVSCRVVSMKEEYGEIRIVGEVVDAQADDSVIDENGNVNLDAMHLISLDAAAGVYRKIGEKAGNAFHDGQKLR